MRKRGVGMVILCDRCNARALARFTKSESDSELAFCGHHKDKYLESLSAQGFIEVVYAADKEFAKAL
jgi:hypothetical protein